MHGKIASICTIVLLVGAPVVYLISRIRNVALIGGRQLREGRAYLQVSAIIQMTI